MEQSNLQSLSFSLEEDSGELHVRFDPVGGLAIPDHGLLMDGLAQHGWSDFHLDDKAIDDFIAACSSSSTEPVVQAIGMRRDGEFSLTVDDDMMTAWLTLVPACGGQPVPVSALEEALRAREIVHGIVHSEIAAVFAAGTCERAAIVRGDPPEEGVATRFERLFDEPVAPADEDEYDRVRYADLCHIQLVKPGDRLMRRVPAVFGKSGVNIKGEPVFPKPVTDLSFRAELQGAAPHPDQPDLLVATSGGQPVALSDGVKVNPVIEVADVDLGTGSIEFEGTLRVGGDVRAGLRVKVTGDVIVNGMVEAAEIVAGGNVAVRGGIVGHPDPSPGSQSLPDTTARIFCQGSVQALFMENAHIEAGKSVLIGRSARQCELLAREEIVVGKAGSRSGQISGGRTEATLRVATGILGASTGTRTYVQVGVDPYLDKQIADHEQQVKRKVDEVDRVIKLLAFFKLQPKKGEGGIAEKAEATRRQLLAQVEGLTVDLKALRDKMLLSEQARVEAAAAIHYGVEVRIGRQVWLAPDDLGTSSIQMQGGQIIINKPGQQR